MALVPFTQLRSLRGLVLSPSGGHAAFVSLRPSLESNQNLAEIMLLDLNENTVRPLTVLLGVPDGPVWIAPDRLAYSAGREVYEVDLEGRVRRRAVHDRPIRHLAAVPGSSLLLGTVSARPQPDGDPYVTTDLPYKRDGRGRLHGADRLVAITAGGDVHDLGPGYAPKPSPDGRRLAHLAAPQSLEFLDADLVVCSLDAAHIIVGAGRRQALPRAVAAFAWSDGGRLAVLANEDIIGAARPNRLLVGHPDGEFSDWTGTEQIWPGFDSGDWTYSASRVTLVWQGEDSVMLLDQRGGAVQPMRVTEAGVSHLSDVDGVASDAVLAPDGGLYAILETPTHPHEVVAFAQDGSTRALTDLNPYTFPAPEHFTVEGENGEAVDVYALYAKEGPAPTVFAIHGGPHGAFMRGIYLDHHRVREAGINVVWANPHGSTGKSHAFAQALVGHWGEMDEKEWRTIRRRLGEMGREPVRLGVWGTSYGGYMSTWLAGHLEDVVAAVIQAPVADQVSMTGSSDIGYAFTPRGLGFTTPTPEDVEDLDVRMARAWQNSPLRTYPNISAATLILVGENDDRCPPSQAEALYTLLRHRNRQPVELVIYPGESHLIARHGKPRSRDDRQQRTVNWLVKYLKDEA